MLACLLSFMHYITSVMLSVFNGLFGVSLLSLPIAMNKITIVNTTSLFCDMLEYAKNIMFPAHSMFGTTVSYIYSSCKHCVFLCL